MHKKISCWIRRIKAKQVTEENLISEEKVANTKKKKGNKKNEDSSDMIGNESPNINITHKRKQEYDDLKLDTNDNHINKSNNNRHEKMRKKSLNSEHRLSIELNNNDSNLPFATLPTTDNESYQQFIHAIEIGDHIEEKEDNNKNEENTTNQLQNVEQEIQHANSDSNSYSTVSVDIIQAQHNLENSTNNQQSVKPNNENSQSLKKNKNNKLKHNNHVSLRLISDATEDENDDTETLTRNKELKNERQSHSIQSDGTNYRKHRKNKNHGLLNDDDDEDEDELEIDSDFDLEINDNVYMDNDRCDYSDLHSHYPKIQNKAINKHFMKANTEPTLQIKQPSSDSMNRNNFKNDRFRNQSTIDVHWFTDHKTKK